MRGDVDAIRAAARLLDQYEEIWRHIRRLEMEQLVQMGMVEGSTQAMGQIDEVLAGV